MKTAIQEQEGKTWEAFKKYWKERPFAHEYSHKDDNDFEIFRAFKVAFESNQPKPVDRAEIEKAYLEKFHVFPEAGLTKPEKNLLEFLLPYFGTPVIDRDKLIEFLKNLPNGYSNSQKLLHPTHCETIVDALFSANIFK